MSKEAMKLALWTLEGWANHDSWVWPESALEQSKRNTIEAITALRQALETEQAMKDVIVGGTGVMLDGKRIDPATIYKEEPVAWDGYCVLGHCGSPAGCEVSNCCRADYTAPQKRELTCVCGAVWEGETMVHSPREREWVGLTDDDMENLFLNEDGVRFARYVEAKLKEKNT